MLKRTLFTTKKSITTKDNQLLIKNDDRSGSVPIEDIGFLVVENHETYISIPSLSKMSEHNVCVVFCNNKHMP